jgi:hypothetical protein
MQLKFPFFKKISFKMYFTVKIAVAYLLLQVYG